MGKEEETPSEPGVARQADPTGFEQESNTIAMLKIYML
jgi:hypothetical protein